MLPIRRSKIVMRKDECPLCGSKTAQVRFELPAGTYIECSVCHLLAVDPIPAFDEMLIRHDLWAHQHHMSELKISQHFSPDFQKIAFGDFLSQVDSYHNNGRLLDLGCSIGGFVDAAQTAGWDAYGVDVSDAVQIAQAHHLKAFQGNLDDQNFQGGYFDVVTMFDVIEHLTDLNKLLESVYSVLRPGGCLLILTPNLNGLNARLMRSKWEMFEPLDHLFLFTPDTLTLLLKRHRFQPVKIQTRDINVLELNYLFSGPRSEEDRKERQKERRQFIDRVIHNPVLRGSRRAVNQLLSWTQLGDKLSAEFVRQPE